MAGSYGTSTCLRAALAFLTAAILFNAQQTRAISKLPSYIDACSRSDPHLNDCILKNGRAVIPIVVHGDPKYRIPKMDPMVIPDLKITQGTDSVGLKLAWKDAEIHGIGDIHFLKSNLNMATKHGRMEFSCPKIRITGKYTASGKVLVLPITGTGPSNITCENMKISFEFDWPLFKKANGKEYIDVTNPKMTLEDIGHMSMRFDNLFNGDRLLGENMNTFLNENWKDIAREIAPGVVDAIGEVFQLVFKNICDNVPFDVVFKP